MRSSGAAGFSLAEQVLAIGLLGLILLAVAAMSVQTKRGGVANRRAFEASCLAQDLLEGQMARSVYDLDLGPQPELLGQLRDQTPYRAVLEVYSLGGIGPASGLTDREIKRILATVEWRDSTGPHRARCESIVAKIPK
jgi:hypothetical protein